MAWSPFTSGSAIVAIMPMSWNSGSQLTSSGVGLSGAHPAHSCAAFAVTFPCVISTPAGRRVDPDVCRYARSSNAMGSSSHRSASARSISSANRISFGCGTSWSERNFSTCGSAFRVVTITAGSASV